MAFLFRPNNEKNLLFNFFSFLLMFQGLNKPKEIKLMPQANNNWEFIHILKSNGSLIYYICNISEGKCDICSHTYKIKLVIDGCSYVTTFYWWFNVVISYCYDMQVVFYWSPKSVKCFWVYNIRKLICLFIQNIQLLSIRLKTEFNDHSHLHINNLHLPQIYISI